MGKVFLRDANVIANIMVCVSMAIRFVCPDIHTPAVPGGRVSNIPGFRMIKRMVGTTRSICDRVTPATCAESLKSMIKTMAWNNTACRDVLMEDILYEFGRFTSSPGANRANRPAGIDTLGPEISIISIILYISVPRLVNTWSRLMTQITKHGQNHYSLHVESCTPPPLTLTDSL